MVNFTSKALFQTIFFVSIFSSFQWKIWLSIVAESSKWAEVIAWKSQVKCKFISSIGTIWEYHPQVAHHFNQKTGQRAGSLKQIIDFLPIFHIAWPSQIVVVVLPSQAGIGLQAVTKISFQVLLFFIFCRNSLLSFALFVQ